MAATHFSGPVVSAAGFEGPTSNTTIAAATTLTAADSGKTFYLNAAAGANITLPAPAAGLKFKFITAAVFATTDWVITATGAIMEGCILEAGAVQDVAGATTINLELAAENVGDFIEMESDGTSWFVYGNFLTAASVTPA